MFKTRITSQVDSAKSRGYIPCIANKSKLLL